MDSKGTVDISNSIQKHPVTLDGISLGYRKAQMVLVVIRSMKVAFKNIAEWHSSSASIQSEYAGQEQHCKVDTHRKWKKSLKSISIHHVQGWQLEHV